MINQKYIVSPILHTVNFPQVIQPGGNRLLSLKLEDGVLIDTWGKIYWNNKVIDICLEKKVWNNSLPWEEKKNDLDIWRMKELIESESKEQQRPDTTQTIETLKLITDKVFQLVSMGSSAYNRHPICIHALIAMHCRYGTRENVIIGLSCEWSAFICEPNLGALSIWNFLLLRSTKSVTEW